jgi:hypothetical protein
MDMMSPFNYVFLLGALFVSSVVGYHSVLGFVSSFGTSYLFAISLETAKLALFYAKVVNMTLFRKRSGRRENCGAD